MNNTDLITVLADGPFETNKYYTGQDFLNVLNSFYTDLSKQ